MLWGGRSKVRWCLGVGGKKSERRSRGQRSLLEVRHNEGLY